MPSPALVAAQAFEIIFRIPAPHHAVLANVGLGLCFSSHGRFKISPAVLHDLHGACLRVRLVYGLCRQRCARTMYAGMWELLAFIGNTLIFGLSGLIIG